MAGSNRPARNGPGDPTAMPTPPAPPGGRVHGSSDRIGAYPATDPVDPVDVHATTYHRMGLRAEQTIQDNLRRPYPICTGRVIAPLVQPAA